MTNENRYRLTFRPRGALLQRARDCEAEVFLQTYGNTPADFADEYGPYERTSHFLALADEDDEVIGACRLIVPGPAGLKTVSDLGRAPWQVDGARAVRATGADLLRTWDVATLAVRPRNGMTWLAAAALYHGLITACRVNDIGWIVMMLDERVRRLLAMLGIVPRPIPGTRPAEYLGSPSTTPLVGDLTAMTAAQRNGNPEGHRLISIGVGLTGITVPDPRQFLLSDADQASSTPDEPAALERIA